MTQEVVVATLNRIEEYLKKTKRKSIELTFLGGEPLITGIDFYRNFFALANKHIHSGRIIYNPLAELINR